MTRLTAVAATLAVTLAGCAGGIPKDGPSAQSFSAAAAVTLPPGPTVDFALVPLSPAAVAAANQGASHDDPEFGAFARRGLMSGAPIAVGDVLAISIFEATGNSGGGLFVPTEAGNRNGNFVTVPNEQVDSSGTVMTPYAGAIHVAGRTPQQVGADIASRLGKRAIEPQVVVTIIERHGNQVSVLGDVNAPSRFALDPGGIRLLDALARSGGPKDPDFETTIEVQRRGQIERAALAKVVRTPAQNIALQPGDVVYASHQPKTFMTLGATVAPGAVGGINNRRFSFDSEHETLSGALAKSGGLDDSRADPRAFFVYRLESVETLRALGVDVSRFEGAIAPTIYSVDLSRPDSFFLTGAFEMRDNDFIFVANSLTPDLNKFLSTVRNITGPVNDASQSAAALR